ncbi:ATP-binding cassette domain-containing protein [Gilliamella sp. B14448G11]|uniref:ABC transporter ATP-binding protein n=1 Tax=unclassified Gilliamella TaxID=2685620 RepID=UPI0018DD7268|nr:MULTISPECIES: ATP-binding cassette domain-containing protein [unclassified Gilliamella]MBI0028017.1 ATP-binding cassette domain-containing protein [Gilliamella sp. B14448G7]MBI0031361.1 ATP-binding cassette domain-containing protein [Gilliamella sp. B14384G15]MBI0034750.1 ATP-binding cassette domain-containing protein [Gilliamella sp. B14448G11]MBI0042246.1 ATP-binding cassette domain-containing protein [Gilliamella sp. B14448G12]MBI0058704.1 ATP-binding cassette domain-containing protein [
MLVIKQLEISRLTGNSSFRVCLPELRLRAGDVVVIQGDSGSGKSTLLEMIGMILKPDNIDDFKLFLDNNDLDIAKLINNNDINQLANIRAQYLGFMLQTGGLLPFLKIYDNLLLPLKLLQKNVDNSRLEYLINKLGISHLLNKYPKQLSIGERQRASFIRSIIHKPALLLADEPTSALDPYNANLLFDLIIEQAKQDNIAAIIVTHDWQRVSTKGLFTLSAKLVSSHSSEFLPLHDRQ